MGVVLELQTRAGRRDAPEPRTTRRVFSCLGQALRTMAPAAQGTDSSETIIFPSMNTKIDCAREIPLELEMDGIFATARTVRESLKDEGESSRVRKT